MNNVRKSKTWLRACSPAGSYHKNFALSFTRSLTLQFFLHVSSSLFSLQSRTAWQSPSCAWRVLRTLQRRVSRLGGNFENSAIFFISETQMSFTPPLLVGLVIPRVFFLRIFLWRFAPPLPKPYPKRCLCSREYMAQSFDKSFFI